MGKTTPGALTPLGIAVLALLAERAMHPYEMYQLLLERREDRLIKVRPGSLYHTVARMVEHGYAHSTGTGREGNRPERTVYEINDLGRQVLRERVAELLCSPMEEYPLFPVALSEAHNLPKSELIELLTQRIGASEMDIAELGAMRDRAMKNEIPRRYWFVIEYQLSRIENEVNWLRGLIDELAGGTLPWQEFNPETGAWEPADHDHPRDVRTWRNDLFAAELAAEEGKA